jgi:hypothetical protein
MMIQEFEQLTSLHPTMMEYAIIEEMYYEFEGDKREFCKKFAAQEEPLLNVARMVASETKSDLEKTQKDTAKEIADLEAKVKRLEAELEKEQEWKPYEDKHNCSDEKYDHLARTGAADELTDDEAADMIAKEFGFVRENISIIRWAPVYEINRHGRLRQVGQKVRRPRFAAWDWNYIRFNVTANVARAYEMVDGELKPFWD